MWGFDPLTTVLIFVLLGCSMTERNVGNEREEIVLIDKHTRESYGNEREEIVVIDKRTQYSSICIKSMLNVSMLWTEVSSAQPLSSLDVISRINEFCRKVPILEKCTSNVTDAMKPILESNGGAMDTWENMTNSFYTTFCRDEGYNLAKFAASGGQKCLSAKHQAAEICASETLGNYMKNYSNAIAFAMNSESCNDVKKFQNCILEALTDCDDATSANTIDELFQYLLRTTPCGNLLDHQQLVPSPTADEANNRSISERIMDFARQKCKRNGGPTAYDSLIKQFSNLTNYDQSIGSRLALWERPSQIRDSYCAHIPEIEECTKHFINALETCLETREWETADIVYNMQSLYINFVCDEKARGFVDLFFAVRASSSPWKSAVQKCAVQAFISYFPSASSLGRLENPLILHRQDCTKLEDLKRCIFQELKESENQTIVNMLESLTESMLMLTPCENLSKAQTSSDTEIPSPPQRKRYGSFEEKCERNGGPLAYAIAKESIDYVSRNTEAMIAAANLKDIDRVIVDSVTYKIICQRSAIFKELEKYLISSVAPCFEPEERKFLKLIDNVTSASLRFMCDNDAERLETFRKGQSGKCWEQKMEDVVQCARNVLGIGSSYISDLFQQLVRYDRPLVLRNENCTNFDKFRDCSVKVLSQCDQQITLDFVVSLIDVVKIATTCESSPEADKQSTTGNPRSVKGN